MPFLSTTKAERIDTPFMPNTKSSYKEPYSLETLLLKSDNKGKFKPYSALNLSKVNKESTEIASTCVSNLS